jgi:3-deoxy-D-manno-octulosonic-acid transferase
VIGWLLNLVYAALLVAVSPVLLWRMIVQGKYRDGWREKFVGRLPVSADDEQVAWLHAVSVGEVLQLRTIVPRLRREFPELTILITTTTVTGRAVASETFPNCRIAYCPLDFTWAVRSALLRVRPVMIGLVELELWPNLIRAAHRRSVPLMLISGRISERSYRGYRRVRPLMRSLLRKLQIIAVQTQSYADRLVDLGAPAERVHVTGSIKFDGVSVDAVAAQSDVLRDAFAIKAGQRVFVAGSTHEPEEQIALEAWQQLRADFPDLRLVLVPRHRERFDEVAAVIEANGFAVRRRSRALPTRRSPASSTDDESVDAVCLLDTLGELSACWGLADVAFVGGSLTRRGGQNMIEPAALGVPVVVGPNTINFRDVVEGLQSVGGIQIARAAEDLPGVIRSLLTNDACTRRQSESARRFVLVQQGATDRTLELMGPLIGAAHPAVQRAA